eukprot:jgi/Psemu1/323238/estExt_fgenesh1_pg.C_630030
MSARKEVRFSDERVGRPLRSVSNFQTTPPPPPPPPRQPVSNALSSSQQPLRATNSWSVPSYTANTHSKIVKATPPPPPPPMRARSPTPPPISRRSKPTPSPRNRKSVPTSVPQNRKCAPTPPPPPPPPRAGSKQQVQRTPVKTQSVSKDSENFFSPLNNKITNGSDQRDTENDEVFVEAPALTMLSPMSGITNITDFNSPSTSTQRKRSTVALDTTLNSTLNSIDMLNFDFIESCGSAPALQRVIRLLNESKRKSPYLLNATKKRLAIVEQQDTISKLTKKQPILSGTSSFSKKLTNDDNKRDRLHLAKGEGLAANLSRITTSNTTLDSIDPGKSSLNFSLSPCSTLHGIDLVEEKTPETNYFDYGRASMDRRLNPIVESPVVESTRRAQKSSPVTHYLELKEHGSRTSPYQKSESESFAAQQIEILKKTLDETSSDKETLLTEIRQVTKQHEETKRTLDLTRATLCKKDEETRNIEERLEHKIAELSQVLADTAARSKLVVEGERTYRKQCEEELSKENKKNAKLNQELQETRNNLEMLQRRHSSFRVELLKVTGISKTQRRGLSQREFLSSLSKKIETMKNDNDRMAQTLAQANKAIEERDVMELQMTDALQVKERLAIENQKLNQKIHELRAEVKSSRAYIDKLLRTSHESRQEDWEKHEQQYKQVIQNLRKQILKQDSVISMDLYRAEKDKVREKTTQLRAAETAIHGLNTKIAALQQEKNEDLNRKESPTNDKCIGENNIQTPKNIRKAFTPKTKTQSQFNVNCTGVEKSKDDLTGITITFLSPESNKISPRAGDMYQRKIGAKQSTSTRNEKKKSVLGDITSSVARNKQNNVATTNESNGFTKKTSREHDFDKYFDSNYADENAMVPKNLPRESSSQLVRDLGGRSALKNKIRKMRSPKMSKAASMSRKVQVIMH